MNYRETHFEYPELTRVHGEPNFESLIRMENELIANAQTVFYSSTVTSRARFSADLKPTKKSAEYFAERFDDFDRSNDETAKRFLLDSLDPN